MLQIFHFLQLSCSKVIIFSFKRLYQLGQYPYVISSWYLWFWSFFLWIIFAFLFWGSTLSGFFLASTSSRICFNLELLSFLKSCLHSFLIFKIDFWIEQAFCSCNWKLSIVIFWLDILVFNLRGILIARSTENWQCQGFVAAS